MTGMKEADSKKKEFFFNVEVVAQKWYLFIIFGCVGSSFLCEGFL